MKPQWEKGDRVWAFVDRFVGPGEEPIDRLFAATVIAHVGRIVQVLTRRTTIEAGRRTTELFMVGVPTNRVTPRVESFPIDSFSVELSNDALETC